jgi:hypothetical protein
VEGDDDDDDDDDDDGIIGMEPWTIRDEPSLLVFLMVRVVWVQQENGRFRCTVEFTERPVLSVSSLL